MYQKTFLNNVLTKLAMLSNSPLIYLQQQNLQQALVHRQKKWVREILPYSLLFCLCQQFL